MHIFPFIPSMAASVTMMVSCEKRTGLKQKLGSVFNNTSIALLFHHYVFHLSQQFGEKLGH